MIIALLLSCIMLWSCTPENVTPNGIEPQEALNMYTAEPMSTDTPAPLTAEPTEEPTPEPQTRFVFQPKVCSVYLEEVFGETMCETWFNLVDAVMAGEDTFACPDKNTYDWVMGQFPRLCFPLLVELIDFAYDRSNPVKDGIGSFTWLVTKEEAAARIEEFAEQIEPFPVSNFLMRSRCSLATGFRVSSTVNWKNRSFSSEGSILNGSNDGRRRIPL